MRRKDFKKPFRKMPMFLVRPIIFLYGLFLLTIGAPILFSMAALNMYHEFREVYKDVFSQTFSILKVKVED